MKEKYIVAFDCGTTAVKAVAVRFDGTVTAAQKKEYPLIQLHTDWAEQDPQTLWEAVCAASKGMMAQGGIRGEDVMGLVFAAPWKNIIPVSRQGKALRNSIIWMDARAGKQAARLNEAAGFFVGTGQEYWPRLMWLKEMEPEIWKQADVIMGLNTFFKWKATGQIATEPSDDFIHACNPKIQEQYDCIIKAAGLWEDREKFPQQKLSEEKVGELTLEAAAQMGLVKGIPVFGGFGDLPAITIGTGCCQTDMVHLYFGTSSWLVDVLEERKEDFAPQYFTFDPTHEGGLFALQTGCYAFDWAVEQFYHAERSILKERVFDFVNEELKPIGPGSDNLIATHWLTGELPPLAKNAKALFFNLTSGHDRRHMVKAVMESICYTHRRYLKQYEKITGKTLSRIRVTGGGAASDLWMQILADVLQIQVEVPESPRNTGAMGSYYCAMVGLGHMADYNAIYHAVRIEKVFQPRKENGPVYDKLYQIYLKLYPALAGLYDEINGVY